MKAPLYLALVHHPVTNKFGDVVTTSITNLDVHDIARSCKTFGVKGYYLITPLESQAEFLARILDFWKSDVAKTYNPHRVNALAIASRQTSIQSALYDIQKQEGSRPLLITTTAATRSDQISFGECRNLSKPVLLLFGTGNGLTQAVHDQANHILQPIAGVNNYNHLSVRSAVAIVLDRLTSEK